MMYDPELNDMQVKVCICILLLLLRVFINETAGSRIEWLSSSVHADRGVTKAVSEKKNCCKFTT